MADAVEVATPTGTSGSFMTGSPARGAAMATSATNSSSVATTAPTTTASTSPDPQTISGQDHDAVSHQFDVDNTDAGLGAVDEDVLPRAGRQPMTKQCDVPGCKGWKALGGKCTTHGGGKRCEIEGCQHLSQGGGFCISHGGGHRCKDPSCSRSARSGFDTCVRHGAHTKRCSKDDCTKAAQRGGFCIKHGGGNRCRHPGCEKAARSAFKVCVRHGARERRCEEGDCTNKALKGGKCKRHGGGNRCQHEDCSRAAETRSKFCISHGAPGRRCQVEDCRKHAMRGGFCIRHGGGRRCANPNCSRSAVSGSHLCVSHGAPRSGCREAGCEQLNAGGGYCKVHGGGRCKTEGCWKVRMRNMEHCQRHQSNVGDNLQDAVSAAAPFPGEETTLLNSSRSPAHVTSANEAPLQSNEATRSRQPRDEGGLNGSIKATEVGALSAKADSMQWAARGFDSADNGGIEPGSALLHNVLEQSPSGAQPQDEQDASTKGFGDNSRNDEKSQSENESLRLAGNRQADREDDDETLGLLAAAVSDQLQKGNAPPRGQRAKRQRL